eukprot:gnl/MRDRNA2_/MRDRNA2_28634_c0_seq1.p1 gnl/MRDRNA2_/MRDRNA2_28634_c0~~gnl/MRDRNA2_/MRDRNA2_28634_c0_seq1.p1  ORF type:complete len:567 (-),score=80.20 gnl/MRDRNA2_/MRDRNA2_28634_c0_seq1:32-1732(-)
MVEPQGQIRNLLSAQELIDTRALPPPAQAPLALALPAGSPDDQQESRISSKEALHEVSSATTPSLPYHESPEFEALWHRVTAEAHAFQNTSGLLLRRVVWLDLGTLLYQWKNEHAMVAQNFIVFVGSGEVVTKALCLSALVGAGVRGHGEFELTFVCGGKSENIMLRTFNEEWAKHWVTNIQDGAEMLISSGFCLTPFVPSDEVHRRLEETRHSSCQKYQERVSLEQQNQQEFLFAAQKMVCKRFACWVDRWQKHRVRQSFFQIARFSGALSACMRDIQQLCRVHHSMVCRRLWMAIVRLRCNRQAPTRQALKHEINPAAMSSYKLRKLSAFAVAQELGRIVRNVLSRYLFTLKYRPASQDLTPELLTSRRQATPAPAIPPLALSSVLHELPAEQKGLFLCKALQRPIYRMIGKVCQQWQCTISRDAQRDAKEIVARLRVVNEEVLSKARCLPVLVGLRALRATVIRIQQRHVAAALVLLSRGGSSPNKKQLKSAMLGEFWVRPQLPDLSQPEDVEGLSTHDSYAAYAESDTITLFSDCLSDEVGERLDSFAQPTPPSQLFSTTWR